MTPFFSIIIPLYNKEHFIHDTINSALMQSFNNFEIIVVDDGSTDNGLKKVKQIKDSRIKLFSIKNSGVSFARNYGITKANADYIVFLDADDYWYPNHLENIESLRKKVPNCGLYACAYEKKYRSNTIPSIYKNIPKEEHWKGRVDDFFESSVVNAIAWTSAVMVPKKVLSTVGNFDVKITLGAGEDTDLWIRIALNYPVAFSNTVTAIHNLHAENRISNSNTNLRQFINLDNYEKYTSQHKTLKTYLDLNRFAIAMQYRLVKNNKQARFYTKKIQLSNLTKTQKALLKINYPTLVILYKLKRFLRTININLSSFK